jgi:hypothetical protein
MTVKELIELLESCNQDSPVFLVNDSGSSELKDEDIFQWDHSVDIDSSVASLAYKREQK